MLKGKYSTVKNLLQKRLLSLHEYRSSQILNQYGVNVPRGSVAFTPEKAAEIALCIPQRQIVIKAQALTGGRGRGHFDNGMEHGVQVLNNDYNTVESVARKMIGHKLITKQSGGKGKFVNGVYIVEKCETLKESYLSILMDRSTQTPLIIASSEGGMNIEEVAKTKPEAIKKFHINNLDTGLTHQLAREIAESLKFDSSLIDDTTEMILRLYQIFKDKDATQIEINPISEVNRTINTKETKYESGIDKNSKVKTQKEVMCMDAKFNIDDNASFRQEELFQWRDLTQEDAHEHEAKKYDLNFVKLNGNIGCLVNGAGLAMATMDVIKLNGGIPANFLDCGGGATPETIKKGFELIMSQDGIQAIFVNIFGGIVRCDHVAQGLITAAKELNIKVPIVVRLQGTNLEQGLQIIKESGIHIFSFDELDPAAEKVVELSNVN